MKRMEPAVCHTARELGLPLPGGYRIEKNGNVTRSGEFNENDPYLRALMLLAYQREMIGEVTKMRKWVTFFGILTIISIIVNIANLLSR